MPAVLITLIPEYLVDNQVQDVNEVRIEDTLVVPKAAWFDKNADVLPDFRISVVNAWVASGFPSPQGQMAERRWVPMASGPESG